MPDIISAKCFGCGHVVKVPAALGGKKARCPKCTNTIAIPAPSDTTEDIVGDEMLPEVARDGEVVEGEWIEEDEGSSQESAEEDRRTPPPRRGSSSSSNPRVRGGGRESGTRGPVARKKSSTGLIVGIIAGVVVVGLIIGLAVGGKGGGAGGKKGAEVKKGGSQKPQANPEDQELESRCMDYVLAVNGGDDKRILKFYSYGEDEERAMGRAIRQFIEQGTKYDSPAIKSASAASGTATFTYAGGKERTISWKKVDGTWLITEKP
jgi:hypothetical protein